MTDPIPVFIKGTDKVLLAEPAPGNQAIQPEKEVITPPIVLPKGDAKASAKTAKVTLVLDPLSITRVLSEGQKQIKLIVTVASMKFEAMVNSKSYRKALASIDELGANSCNVILQASMTIPGTLEAAGLAVMPKLQKSAETEYLTSTATLANEVSKDGQSTS
jgi:hypothetical protein